MNGVDDSLEAFDLGQKYCSFVMLCESAYQNEVDIGNHTH
jgi:hypothetical protein